MLQAFGRFSFCVLVVVDLLKITCILLTLQFSALELWNFIKTLMHASETMNISRTNTNFHKRKTIQVYTIGHLNRQIGYFCQTFWVFLIVQTDNADTFQELCIVKMPTTKWEPRIKHKLLILLKYFISIVCNLVYVIYHR